MRLRDLLGLFSLAIAVAAVALALATGEGSRRVLRELAEAVNPNVLVLRVEWPLTEAQQRLWNRFEHGYGLTQEELGHLRSLPGVRDVAMRGNASVVTGQRYRLMQRAVDDRFGPLLNLPLVSGRWLASEDLEFALPFTVVGATAAHEFFGEADPLGQTIDTGLGTYRVVGVMGEIPPDLLELKVLDAEMLVPETTTMTLGRQGVFTGFVEYEPGRRQEVTSVLRAALDTLPTGPLFSIVTIEAWLGDPFVFRREVASGLDSAVLWTVALALLAAAANLANLFALRVYDRLGVIGVQRAVGATRRRVVRQVLAGILWLGLLGSLAGTLLFALLVPVLQRSFGEQLLATPYSLGLAVAIGIATALAAGAAPAYWAVTLPVAQALRDKPRPLFREGVGLVGLIVGIGALIASTSIADGAERWVEMRIDELGGRRIVYSTTPSPQEAQSILLKIRVNEADYEALDFAFLDKKAFVAVDNLSWNFDDGRPTPEDAPASYRYVSFAYVQGDFFEFASRPFIAGGPPAAPDEIVVGGGFVARWFPERAPEELIDETLTFVRRTFLAPGQAPPENVEQRTYRVAGVTRAGSYEGIWDLPDDIISKPQGPEDTAAGTGPRTIHLLIREDTDFAAAVETVNAFLSERHPGDFAPVQATYPAGDLRPIRQALQQTSQGYRAVALVTLLVGGFGLANVMLLRVAKRRTEVGLRRAAGATRQKIVRLFLLESARLALLGGLAGLLAGAIGAYLVASASPWQPFVAVLWIPLGLGTALVTGLLFGAYPAWQAAQLTPASALRSE